MNFAKVICRFDHALHRSDAFFTVLNYASSVNGIATFAFYECAIQRFNRNCGAKKVASKTFNFVTIRMSRTQAIRPYVCA